MLDQKQDAGDGAPEAKVPSLTLGEYLAEAGKALRTCLPKAWVDAVVLDAKATRSGLSLELVEPFADDRHDGRLRCLMWARTRTALENELGLPLDVATLKGTQLRVLLQTTFHPRYHLEGQVLGLDPRIVGSLVAKRVEQIRAALRQENLFGAQRRLVTPPDITSVVVIHPDRSAGWADVRAELERLETAGILSVRSCPVPFEGAGSAGRIADLVGEIGGGSDRPDLILLVRGGGAAAGLASLANLSLARAVCRCPVPIVTGLGHASDRSIIDDLAWSAADTPSKALGVVKSILRQRATGATEDYRSIVEAMRRLVSGTLQPLLASSREALEDAADRMTATQATRLREMSHDVERHVIAFRGSIDLTQADLDRVAGMLLEVAPRVPRTAAVDLRSICGGIVGITRARLPATDALEALRSAGIVRAFVERQAAELRGMTSNLEAAMRRRLGDEAARLAAASAAAQALDVTGTLARGYALPLDGERRIIRSVKTAKDADRFELLFADGSVACRPVIV